MDRSRANMVVSGNLLPLRAAVMPAARQLGRRGAFHDWALHALPGCAVGPAPVAGTFRVAAAAETIRNR